MSKFKKLLDLFFTMFKIGLFTFGGGYAMVGILENELVERKKVMKSEEFLDLLAISESTPGPIAINSATYIGYKLHGVLGSILATLAISLPSLIIIYIISLFFYEFLSLTIVNYAFKGIQVAVCYLILNAGIKMFKKIKKTPLSITLFVLVFLSYITLTLLSKKFSSIYYIIIGGLVSLITFSISHVVKKKKEKKNDLS
ncbi:MAG: chromate transporter [Clostridia bacterium]|nr:chromate transporter [Clostridia bacterium]